jgi:methyl-accepting chemotaxis protein
MDLFWNMLFGGQQPVGMAVNLLIIALFAFAILDILRGRARLRKEAALVKTARARLNARKSTQHPSLKSEDEDEDQEEEEDDPQSLSVHARATLAEELNIPADTLLGHRVSRAMQLRLAGLGSRDVLQQLTSEKLGSYGALARQIGASLTLLGLLGTVFGLSQALLHIGGASDIKGVEDLAKLSQDLGGTMEGMKTAFGCTLMGLLSALILSYFNFGLRRVQSVVLGEIEEFTACDLLPVIEQVDPESDNATRAFANVLSKTSTNLTGLGSDLLDSAQEYRASSSEMRDSIERLVQSVELFSLTINQVAGNQHEFTQTMSSTREAVSSVRDVVQDSSHMLSEKLEQIRYESGVSAKLQQSLASHHEEFKKLAESLRNAQLESVAAALATHERASKQLIEGLLQSHLAELKKVVDGQRDVMRTVSDMVCDVQLNGRARNSELVGVPQ